MLHTIIDIIKSVPSSALRGFKDGMEESRAALKREREVEERNEAALNREHERRLMALAKNKIDRLPKKRAPRSDKGKPRGKKAIS
jgi:Sec-independent protein translocase protein TatA